LHDASCFLTLAKTLVGLIENHTMHIKDPLHPWNASDLHVSPTDDL